MTNSLIQINLDAEKGIIEEIIKEIHELTQDIQHKELSQTVSDLRNRIHDPFMFVICGEVKVGKSSFINALLESKTEICKVAPSPMTDTIQLIVYGPEYQMTALSPVLKRISYPEDILKEIAIVDTPGTNTIIAHHQEITENFVPTSDLVIFVFEAKNPYRQSAWDFFNFIKTDWQKKVIFVLQQKDLIDPADLQINIRGLEQYAKEKGISNPLIFPVSAKMDLEGKKVDSGFLPLREFIAKNITGGKASLYKMINNIKTSETVVDKIESGILIRKDQFAYDMEFRNDITKTLSDQEKISNNNINMLVENLLASYDTVTNSKRKTLEDGLGFFNVLKRGIGGIFNKGQSLQTWLKEFTADFESSLNTSMKDKLQNGLKDISDSIQQMGQIVSLKIQNSKTILKNDHEVFSAIAEKRSSVMNELHDTFQEFLKNTENYYSKDLVTENNKLAPNVATGTGIAIVGAMLTALTHGAVFDITGGILTTVGLLFAGITLGFNKRKIINQFDAELLQGRAKLGDELRNRLNSYVGDIKLKINYNFKKLDDHLEKEKDQIQMLVTKQNMIQNNLNQLKQKMYVKCDEVGISRSELN
ncbi:MAG: dynamin family protein [Saprospiraceae bacterium]|nr:dynamin family protein [Saprospiraceae bacterium]MBK9995333.1 dynamin family protein [Saprospiraceae bacterium]